LRDDAPASSAFIRPDFRSPKYRFHFLTHSIRPLTRSRSPFPRRKQKRLKLKLHPAGRRFAECWKNISRAGATATVRRVHRSQWRSGKVCRLWAHFGQWRIVADANFSSEPTPNWVRTFCLIYWIARLIDWLVGEAFNVVTLFGGNPENAGSSPAGRKIFAAAQFVGWLFFVPPRRAINTFKVNGESRATSG